MSALDHLDPGSTTGSSAARPPDSPITPGEVVADAWVVGPRYQVRGDVHLHRCARPDDTRIAAFRYRGSQPLPRFLDALRAAGEAWADLRPTDGRMPPVVPTLGVGRIVNHTTCYWVQESPRGPSLAELLAPNPVFAPDYACRLARQLGEALVQVHAAGLVHGDLDPDNVHLLGNADWVRIAWGGLAVRLEAAGMDPGRPSLSEVAPEILQGQPASARSDLYAAAALLYRLVAGQPPWLVRRKGPLPGVTLADPLPPLPTWAAPLATVLEVGLQRDPELRPESVADWLDRLVEAEVALRDLPPPVGTWAPTVASTAEPPPPTVNRTLAPGEELEALDPVLANAPPGAGRMLPPPPNVGRSVTPAIVRRVAAPAPPVTPPVPREVPAPRAWWVPWAVGGAAMGALAFVVALVVVYQALTAARIAGSPPAPAEPARRPTEPEVVVAAPAPAAAPPPVLTLESEPPGAQVLDPEGLVLGTTPFEVPLTPGRPAWFELRLAGYEPREITQEWSPTSVKRVVELRRRARTTAQPPLPPDPPLRDHR